MDVFRRMVEGGIWTSSMAYSYTSGPLAAFRPIIHDTAHTLLSLWGKIFSGGGVGSWGERLREFEFAFREPDLSPNPSLPSAVFLR